MYVDVWNRSEIFRNSMSVQGLMTDHNDQTKLIKLTGVINLCRNPRDMLEIICV